MPAEREQPLRRPEAASIRAVQQSVARLAGREHELSARFYEHLFAMLPEVRALFPDDLSAQRVRLLQALLATVEALDAPEELEQALWDLGADHYRMGVQEHQYQYAGHALVRALRDLAGDDWSTRHSSAWVAVYSWMISHMVRGARHAHLVAPSPGRPGTGGIATGAHRREGRH